MLKIDDFDNDGDKDIITFSDANIMGFVHLYENLGNNIFDTINNFNIYKGCTGFLYQILITTACLMYYLQPILT